MGFSVATGIARKFAMDVGEATLGGGALGGRIGAKAWSRHWA